MSEHWIEPGGLALEDALHIAAGWPHQQRDDCQEQNVLGQTGDAHTPRPWWTKYPLGKVNPVSTCCDARATIAHRTAGAARSRLVMADAATRTMAALYSRVAADYVDYGPPRFAYTGRRLVELANLQPGDTVLDLGTGRGAVLVPAAERVGPTGRAVGIDLAEGMVSQTSTSTALKAMSWASVRLMDAEQLDFADASFSHVLGSYSVFFFPHLDLALAEAKRVLRPQGVVGFAFERGTDPAWRWYEDVLRERGVFARVRRMPGEGNSIREPGVLVARLESAGFGNVREITEEVDLPFVDAASWWRSLWTHGPRAALDALTPEELEEVMATCLERVQGMTTPSGIPERHNFVYVLGRRD